MRELDLIEAIRRGSAGKRSLRGVAVALGIGDDCAVLRVPPGHEVLVTTDFSLEGRHFRRDWHSPESVGHRCLARGLSDLAAMGAEPLAAFLSLALPANMLTTVAGQKWVRRFFEGLRGLGDRYGVSLAGGDTAEAPGGMVLADIVLVGSAPAGKALRRSGAKTGDLLYCTGALGGAAAELNSLMAGKKIRSAASPQLFPEPRLAVGTALLRRGLASACMDMSDGLSTDLAHLCRASGVNAEVQLESLPLHPAAARLSGAERRKTVLHGGEDYELLFAAPAAVKMPRMIAGVAITPIGRFVRRKAGASLMTLVGTDGMRTPLEAAGWEHFSSEGK
jgi:thiamine-monophosphate kinase